MSAAVEPITLRAPDPSDRDHVRSIVAATGVFRPAEVDIALEVFDGAMTAPGVDYHAIGAYEDDVLLGLTMFGATPGTVATWDLYWIAVDPDGHRRGTGRHLMEAAERAIASQGGRLVVVETSSRPDYGPTRAFYTSLGYERSARIPDYYAPHDDLIVFTKRLSSPSRDG